MSIDITIKNAVKRYGANTVLPNLSLEIHEGEFFTLLGPSGCGKTTLLRMIAGFNTIEGGDFYFNDTRINDLDPAKRNIGMVFQNYAIFPHMTVKNNVAYGLRNRKLDSEQIQTQTEKFLAMMKIKEYENRLPERLSGGQQQRVALARALAIQPDVLLMDEPLSNLDAKLRVEMREVIKEIQNNIGITTVYVTHDQEEAMAISDRIAVINEGVIQQIGTPKILYQRPDNLFVATFIGRTNILGAETYRDGDTMGLEFEGKKRVKITNFKDNVSAGKNVQVSIRPEEFQIGNPENAVLSGVVEDSIFLGLNTHYFVRLESGQKVEIIQESTIGDIISKKARVSLKVNTEKINVFSDDGFMALINQEG